MTSARIGEIDIEYDLWGSPANPPLLLVMGLGAQMISWDPPFLEALAAAGLFVIRFDNRDSGLSTHFHEAGIPNLLEALLGDPIAPYSLGDMADDAAGLLRHLEVGPAHVVGISMGGMIAQLIAIRHPELVLSLTSIMSGPGGAASVAPEPAVIAALLDPPAADRDGRIEQAVALRRVLAGTGANFEEEPARVRAAEQYERSYSPESTARQAMAVLAAPDRVRELGGLRLPVLVVHGEADPLVPHSAGVSTAEAIPGARLISFPGLGHDLPLAFAEQVVAAIVEHVQAPPRPSVRP